MTDENRLQFSSYFWGGYECLYAKVKNGERINQLKDTKHDIYCRQDYRLIKPLGIKTVREGLAWHQIDKNGKFDFSGFEQLMKIGQEEGIQQIWDLNHFDYPEDVDPFSEQFISRFSRYAAAAIRVIKKYDDGVIYVAPINEISFFTLIGADEGNWAPYAKKRGLEFKKQLVRAAIAAMDAIWAIDKTVRFIHVDPIFRRVPMDPGTRLSKKIAAEFFEAKFQAWDMIAGKISPELGGHPKYLDILGCNYYYYNQEWILPKKAPDGSRYMTMPWNSADRVSMATMLKEVYDRYGRPIVVSETGGWGALRRMWWPRTFRELKEALDLGLPIYGICAYPIIDRADWIAGHLTNSGLWDFKKNDPLLRRHPHAPTIRVVEKFIKSLL